MGPSHAPGEAEHAVTPTATRRLGISRTHFVCMARFVPGYPLLVSGHTTGDVYVWELPVSQAGSRTDHHLIRRSVT